MISPYDIFTMCAPYIYTCHTSHNFVEESSSIQYSTYCMIEMEHKIQHVPIFRNCVTTEQVYTMPSQIFTTYNSQRYFQEFTSLLPKRTNNNTIFLLPTCVTTKGRTWPTSQDHTDFTQLIWRSSIKTHIVNLQKLNYVK